MDRLVVVIPAHNEARVLERCLAQVIGQEDVHLRIIVVANGCVDDTVAVADSAVRRAEERGHVLDVIELVQPSKAAALNAGDAHSGHGPRLYLDADALLGPGAARDLARALRPGTGVHLAAPHMYVERPTGRFTRSYVAIWTQLPYVQSRVLGCGAYAVSALGRQRWGHFPGIISDDRFVRLHFGLDEQRVIATSDFTVALPERARELFATRARWSRGNRQLERRFPELAARDRGRLLPSLAFIACRPGLWSHVPAFATLFAYASIRALVPARGSAWTHETSSTFRTT